MCNIINQRLTNLESKTSSDSSSSTSKEKHAVPNANAGFDWLSMFKFTPPLSEDLLNGVCIL